jgi:hypothetical protein
MSRRSSPLVAALLALRVAACERAPAPDASEAPPSAPPAAPADESLYPVEIEPGISLAVRKTGSREYMLDGYTDRTDEVTLSVEDGHYILFGPVEIGVDQQRFRIDFIIDPTDRDHIFFYLTGADGERLAVVPVDTARELTTAGPPSLQPIRN